MSAVLIALLWVTLGLTVLFALACCVAMGAALGQTLSDARRDEWRA